MRVSKRALRTTQGFTPLALAGLLYAVFSRTPVAAQEPGYILKENVRLVIVPVTVKDRHGNLVEDLAQKDFRVFEGGQERSVQFFSNESVPLSAVILLDTGMSEASAAAVRSTLRSLSESFGPEDEEALYLFDNTIRLVADFTSQADSWSDLARKALPAGRGPALIGGPLGTPLTVNGVSVDRPGTAPVLTAATRKRIEDALYTAAQRLKDRSRERRRVVVIVSDGMNGSDNDFSHPDVLNALANSEVTVYAASLGGGWAMKRVDLLARVTRETGGDIAYAQRRASLERAFFGLTGEARNPYILGFAPASADGRFHEIQVRVARSGVRSMARSRFFSPLKP